MTGLYLGILLTAGPSLAGEAFVASERLGPKTFRVRGGFEVAASSAAAWRVLTDYDRLNQFVPGMRLSRVKEKRANGVLLEQEAEGRFFIFSRSIHVLLDVHEEPFRRILFQDVLLKDFRYYEGSWTIEESSGALQISYSLQVQLVAAAPKTALTRNARNLLDNVRREIVRRKP